MGNFRSIQFLRFIAAFLVVLSHSEYLFAAYSPAPDRSAAYVFGFGAVGVHIFFVISGFVMFSATFGSAETASAPSFLYRRFVRIFPIYWIYAVLFLAVIYARGDGIQFDYSIVKSLFLIPGYSSLIIGQGWSLSYELYFYLCFAACIWLGALRCMAALSIIFVGSILLRGLLPTSIGAVDIVSNPLLLEFMLGSAIATAFLSGLRISSKVARALIIGAIVAFAAGLWIGYSRLPSLIMWGAPSAVLILGLTAIDRNDELPGLIGDAAWLGDSSYSLYLLHPIILLPLLAPIAMSAEVPLIGLITILVTASVASCLISIVAYNKIEGPLTAWLRRGPSFTRRKALQHNQLL